MKAKRVAKFKHVNELTHVWYSDAPITSDDFTERKISIKELEEKVGGNFKFSENVYCDKNFSETFAKTNITQAVVKKILHCVKKPLIDKLVICYMGEEVGFGVFARSEIKMGDVVAIYNGVLSKRGDEDLSGYSFDVGDEDISNFHIDAAEIGGIARFFQHLPYDPKVVCDRLIPLLKKNPALIQSYLEIDGQWSDLTKGEQQASLRNLTQDIVGGRGEYFRGMLNYKMSEVETFEAQNLELSHYASIAYANLAMGKLVLDPKNPILYLYAQYSINRGEQLGFSYSIGYWSNIGRLPLLFDESGKIIPREFYKFKKMPIAVRLPGKNLKAFPYTRDDYQKAVGKQEAVLIGQCPWPVSFFSTRRLLARNNVIAKTHLPKQESEFVKHLRERLPQDIVIETYDRFPGAKKIEDKCVYDVVCRTKSFQRWAQLTAYLRYDNIIGGFCKSLRYSGEIIILGANQHASDLYEFINSHSIADAKKHFETVIPQHQLPEDPGYENISRIFPHL